MDYLYITLNKNASQYAISLDEIFLTLYGFGRKRKFISQAKRFTRRSYDMTPNFVSREAPGIVYRIEVTAEQHDAVRDILCDFLMESHQHRYSLRKRDGNFSSAEFVAYILDETEIIEFEDSRNGIAEDDLECLSDLDIVDVIYEGDLRRYVMDKTQEEAVEHSNVRYLHSIEKDKKVMEYGAAQYEYVPHQMKELVTAD